MGSITVINRSILADHAALMRVAALLVGDEHKATHDNAGNKIVNIRISRKNTYLVTDV